MMKTTSQIYSYSLYLPDRYEVMTPSGWKPISEVEVGECVQVTSRPEVAHRKAPELTPVLSSEEYYKPQSVCTHDSLVERCELQTNTTRPLCEISFPYNPIYVETKDSWAVDTERLLSKVVETIPGTVDDDVSHDIKVLADKIQNTINKTSVKPPFSYTEAFIGAVLFMCGNSQSIDTASTWNGYRITFDITQHDILSREELDFKTVSFADDGLVILPSGSDVVLAIPDKLGALSGDGLVMFSEQDLLSLMSLGSQVHNQTGIKPPYLDVIGKYYAERITADTVRTIRFIASTTLEVSQRYILTRFRNCVRFIDSNAFGDSNV